MAGTNFWGTEKEKEGFSAPSMDDKLIEVAGVTGFTHLATTKVLGIQNQRLAQCRYAKVTVLSEMPMQVDGEARMQQPGTITITHKNKARVIAKDKVTHAIHYTCTLRSHELLLVLYFEIHVHMLMSPNLHNSYSMPTNQSFVVL